jgi:hypothetical protein
MRRRTRRRVQGALFILFWLLVACGVIYLAWTEDPKPTDSAPQDPGFINGFVMGQLLGGR